MTWAFWLYASIAVPWLACAAFYGLRTPWWRSAIGRSLFGSWTALALVLMLAAAFRAIRLPHPIVLGLAVCVLGAVGVAGVVQLVTVIYLQRRGRPAPHRRTTDR